MGRIYRNPKKRSWISLCPSTPFPTGYFVIDRLRKRLRKRLRNRLDPTYYCHPNTGANKIDHKNTGWDLLLIIQVMCKINLQLIYSSIGNIPAYSFGVEIDQCLLQGGFSWRGLLRGT